MGVVIRLAPLFIPWALVFGGGIAVTAAQALGYWLPAGPPAGGAGWEAGFGPMLAHPLLAASVGFSLYVALASAVAATAAGTLAAWAIWRLPPAWQGPAMVYKIPLILPHVSVAFVTLLTWSQSGFASSVAHALGLVDRPGDFPALLFGRGGLGLILAYGFKGAGFVTLMALAALRRLDPRLIATARMLGASAGGAFRLVALPHLAPTLNASFLILFLYAFGAFDIPYLLSGSVPAMLPVTVYNLLFQRGLEQRPMAMAMLACMFCFASLFIGAYVRAARRVAHGVRKL